MAKSSVGIDTLPIAFLIPAVRFGHQDWPLKTWGVCQLFRRKDGAFPPEGLPEQGRSVIDTLEQAARVKVVVA
jgi:hypothetical protein